MTRSFGVFFVMRLNKRLSKQSWDWWFETTSCLLWRHCNVYMFGVVIDNRDRSREALCNMTVAKRQYWHEELRAWYAGYMHLTGVGNKYTYQWALMVLYNMTRHLFIRNSWTHHPIFNASLFYIYTDCFAGSRQIYRRIKYAASPFRCLYK